MKQFKANIVLAARESPNRPMTQNIFTNNSRKNITEKKKEKAQNKIFINTLQILLTTIWDNIVREFKMCVRW